MKLTCSIFLALTIVLDLLLDEPSGGAKYLSASLDKHIIYALLVACSFGVLKLKKGTE